MAHQDHSWKIFQNKCAKNIPFLDENIPYLEAGRGGGVSRALTKKTYPMLFLHSWGLLHRPGHQSLRWKNIRDHKGRYIQVYWSSFRGTGHTIVTASGIDTLAA